MKRLLLINFITAISPAFADDLPVPPIPPERPPIGEAAPTPNIDARVPMSPPSERPSVDVRLFRADTLDPSLGFAPGSRFQTAEERKPIQTPGLSVTVPLK
jgi:hypothetical protein